MKVFGSDEDGFSVALEAGTNTVSVSAWGFWPREIAAAFASAVLDACGTHLRGGRVVMDLGRLKPQRDDGQEAFRSLMTSLPKQGVTRVVVSTINPLTKLQLLRIARDSAARDLVEFPETGARGR